MLGILQPDAAEWIILGIRGLETMHSPALSGYPRWIERLVVQALALGFGRRLRAVANA